MFSGQQHLFSPRGVRHAENNSIIWTKGWFLCTEDMTWRQSDSLGPDISINEGSFVLLSFGILCLNFLQMLNPNLLLSIIISKCDLKFLFQMLTVLLCRFGIHSNGSVVDALKFSALLSFLFCSADLDMAATFPWEKPPDLRKHANIIASCSKQSLQTGRRVCVRACFPQW